MQRRHLRKALHVLVHGEVHHVHKRHHKLAQRVHHESARWRKAAGVVGFGIAERVTRGRRHRELTLKVYVQKKKSRAKVQHPVPRTLRIPGVPGRIRTDVVEVGKVTFQASVAPGADIGHPQALNGTLGCFVRRTQDNSLCLLSNTHVLAPLDKVKVGDLIIQPSAQHGGNVTDGTIAAVVQWTSFTFSREGYPNLVDAAIARVVEGVDVDHAIPRIGIPNDTSSDIRVGMLVQKTGAKSGYTTAKVVDVDFVIAIPYVAPDGTVQRVGFRDQVKCEPFTEGGDSGALVLSERGEAVGLHFAGSPVMSVFNRIGNVLDELDVKLVTA